MKIRLKKNEETGDFNIDYSKVCDKAAFRCRLLNAAVAFADSDVTVYVDTNIRIGKRLDKELRNYLERCGTWFEAKCVDAKANKFFGVNVGSFIKEKKSVEYVMVFEAPPKFFSADAFGKFLTNMDIAVGIGRRRCFEEVSTAFFENADAVMFNADWFDTFLYDAVGYAMLRSSLDVSKTVSNLKV